MSEDVFAQSSISRRDVIKRGAVVGGLVWAAPTLKVLAPHALAQTETGTPFPGEVSWVMVWFQCGDQHHLVKYEATGSGYDENCAATRQNVSANSENCLDFFDVQQTKVTGDRSNDCPDGVTATALANGDLQITIAPTSNCVIVGWVLHDGSCKDDSKPPEMFCRSPEEPFDEDGNRVGPVVPTTSGGDFVWTKCA